MEYEVNREEIAGVVRELSGLVGAGKYRFLNIVYGLVESAGRVVAQSVDSPIGAAELTRLLQDHLSTTVATGLKVRGKSVESVQWN